MKRGPWIRAAGWLLLLVPLVPLRRIFDDPTGTTWLLPPEEWLLGLLLFGGFGWVAARVLPGPVERAAGWLATRLEEPSWSAFRLGGLGLLAVVLVGTSTLAFANGPLLIDSIIQLFQAKIFAGGATTAPAPPHEAFFTTQHMLIDGGRWYAQYPPGHSGALTVGVLAGAPWLVPVLLSLGTAWLIADTARRLFGDRVARLTLVLLVLAPFFWFMGASFMNHVSSLFFVALFLWSFVRWETSDTHPAWILLAGAALGASFLSRPLPALAVGVALAIPAIRIAGKRWWVAGLTGAAGFLALASLYPLFNAATTGAPFVPGYLKLWGPDHGMGFHMSPWGDLHTPLTGLRNELVDLALLHTFLFEWAIPALLPLGAFLVAGWAARRWEARLLVAFFAIPAAYFFYWHRDAFLGPRYLYEGLPFLIPLVAVAFLELRKRWRGVDIPWLMGVDAGTLFAAIVGLSFGYAVFYGTPQRFRVYATGMESVKVDLTHEAREAGIDEGLVFVKVSWGNRLIARAREAGVSATVAERVYRSSDHCELELTVRTAEAEEWEAARLEEALLGIMRPEDEIEVVRLNGDPTLRLVPGRPLAEPCAEEALYDRGGDTDELPDPPPYTNYSPHLAANSPDLTPPFVFARDLRERNGRLRAEYPGLPAYLWDGRGFTPLP